MSLHRFFVDRGRLVSPPSGIPTEVVIDGDEAKHLSLVLRLRPGNVVMVCDGTGFEYETVLTMVSARECRGVITAGRPGLADPKVLICLLPGLSKGAKMDLVVQKCTELGVAVIHPIVTERSVVRLEPRKAEERAKRWERIAREAAKQSGRALWPSVLPPVSLRDALSEARIKHLLVAYEGATRSIREELDRLSHELAVSGSAEHEDTCCVGIIVGPEGGLTPSEVSEIEQRGGIPVSLGRRILRTETASIAAVTLVLYALYELDPPQSPKGNGAV